MFLYKYCKFDDYTKDNLSKGQIHFNSLDRFNDPFEGLTKVEMKPLDLTNGYVPKGSNQDCLPPEISKQLYEGLTDSVSEDFADSINYRYRVTCFSTCFTNPLLWAHYADSHNGICIAYSKEDLEKINIKVSPVIYTYSFPVSLLEDTNEFYNATLNAIYSKSAVWSYENEWRAVVEFNEEIEISFDEFLNRYKNNSDYVYFEDFFTKKCYKSLKNVFRQCKPQHIYSGCKMPEEDNRELENICNERGYNLSRMNTKKYKYEFEEFPYPKNQKIVY